MNVWIAQLVSYALAMVAMVAPVGFAPVKATLTPAPRIVWVSQTGSDSNTGDERASPVRSLRRAHELLCPTDHCPGLGRPVEIRIEPGTYHLPDTTWQYFDDVHPTRFVPADWKPGWTWSDVRAAGGRPVLDGRWTTAVGLSFTPRRPSSTGRTNLEFRYLEWSRYDDYALQIRSRSGQWAAGNLISGNRFHHVGNWWDPSRTIGYGGLSLWSTSRNTVVGNHFSSIVNAPVDGDSNGHEHGIYMIEASDNIIRGNRFLDIGGDAVRVANGSDDNLIEANVFERTSNRGHVSDWYCRIVNGCQKMQRPSHGNVVRGNTFGAFYPAFWTIGPRTVYCYDRPGGACPENRIKLVP